MILNSAEKFYICFRIDISLNDDLVFSHTFDARNQEVFFYLADCLGMGDILAILPSIEQFRREHNCRVTCYVKELMQDIVRKNYPFVLRTSRSEDTYATYFMGAWRGSPFESPIESRLIPLTDTGNSILGLSMRSPQLRLHATEPPKIVDKYVCIAIQASAPIKYWLYPNGWNIVVRYLKTLGYRVLVINREAMVSIDSHTTIKLPNGAEDFTGDHSLTECVELLTYAEFFIGVGSGLAWLAHAVDIPVILISGFSLPYTEFYTPYRIFNPLVCHGCYNNPQLPFNECRYKGTPRVYECSRSISPQQVTHRIDRLLADKKNPD